MDIKVNVEFTNRGVVIIGSCDADGRIVQQRVRMDFFTWDNEERRNRFIETLREDVAKRTRLALAASQRFQIAAAPRFWHQLMQMQPILAMPKFCKPDKINWKMEGF